MRTTNLSGRWVVAIAVSLLSMTASGTAQDKRAAAPGIKPSQLIGVWEIEPYYLATRPECG